MFFNHTHLLIEKFCIFSHACQKLIIVTFHVMYYCLSQPSVVAFPGLQLFITSSMYSPPLIMLVLVHTGKIAWGLEMMLWEVQSQIH